MPTYTALTTLPDEAKARGLGEAMEHMDPAPEGIGVFEMEDGSGLWEVGGYFEDRPSEADLAVLTAAFDCRPFSVSELPQTDWVSHVRRELAPVTAGRFHLYGSHDAETVPEGVVPLLIEAAMAFGTGHHGTTLGCLRAFDRLLTEGFAPSRIVDIGCGTAVLAMAAAKTRDGAGILASDMDIVAVETAEANIAENRLAGRIACLEATGFDHPRIAGAAPFDLIFANILMGPLVALAPDMAAHAAPGARVILSGILNDQAEEVVAAYRERNFAELDREVIGDWTTLVLAFDQPANRQKA